MRKNIVSIEELGILFEKLGKIGKVIQTDEKTANLFEKYFQSIKEIGIDDFFENVDNTIYVDRLKRKMKLDNLDDTLKLFKTVGVILGIDSVNSFDVKRRGEYLYILNVFDGNSKNPIQISKELIENEEHGIISILKLTNYKLVFTLLANILDNYRQQGKTLKEEIDMYVQALEKTKDILKNISEEVNPNLARTLISLLTAPFSNREIAGINMELRYKANGKKFPDDIKDIISMDSQSVFAEKIDGTVLHLSRNELRQDFVDLLSDLLGLNISKEKLGIKTEKFIEKNSFNEKSVEELEKIKEKFPELVEKEKELEEEIMQIMKSIKNLEKMKKKQKLLSSKEKLEKIILKKKKILSKKEMELEEIKEELSLIDNDITSSQEMNNEEYYEEEYNYDNEKRKIIDDDLIR